MNLLAKQVKRLIVAKHHSNFGLRQLKRLYLQVKRTSFKLVNSMQGKFRNLWAWIRPNIKLRRRTRRLSSVPTTIAQFRRSRTSTVSSYYSAAEENNVDWISRTSPANPNHHEDMFLDPFRPWKIDCLDELRPISQTVKEAHAFNPQDCSSHIYVLDNDPLTIHRLPIAQSTDAIRGKVGYEHGMHVWKIVWPARQRGTNAVIGVATKEHSLRNNGYTSLIGSEEGGYGWDISKNFCFNNSKEKDAWAYPEPFVIENYAIPAEIYCILDMDDGYLAFATKDRFLGVAFRGLKGKKLYPMVSAVWGHCEITMEYLGSIYEVPPLIELCRRQIRKKLIIDGRYFIEELPVSNSIKQYLTIEPHPVY